MYFLHNNVMDISDWRFVEIRKGLIGCNCVNSASMCLTIALIADYEVDDLNHSGIDLFV